MQCNAVLYSTVHYSTIQHNTRQCKTIQDNTRQHRCRCRYRCRCRRRYRCRYRYHTIQDNTRQENATRHRTKHNTIQHNGTRHDTTRHDTTRHNTIQYKQADRQTHRHRQTQTERQTRMLACLYACRLAGSHTCCNTWQSFAEVSTLVQPLFSLRQLCSHLRHGLTEELRRPQCSDWPTVGQLKASNCYATVISALAHCNIVEVCSIRSLSAKYCWLLSLGFVAGRFVDFAGISNQPVRLHTPWQQKQSQVITCKPPLEAPPSSSLLPPKPW